MLISSVTLFAFILSASFRMWPQTVLVIPSLAGMSGTRDTYRLACIRWGFVFSACLGESVQTLIGHSGSEEAGPTGKGKDNDSLISQNTVVGDKEKGNKKQARSAHARNCTTRPHGSNTILHIHYLYTSAVRFFERQLPHNTIIPEHHE